MNRHVLSILVENQSGVLSHVSGLFSRRGYNIHSLSVGITEDPNFSRITIVTFGDDMIIDQIKKQLAKLIDVVKVVDLNAEESVYRELALIKVKATAVERPQIVGIVDVFRANIIDVDHLSIAIEMTGDQSKIVAFLELMRPYGIVELARTGLTALQRGSVSIKDNFDSE